MSAEDQEERFRKFIKRLMLVGCFGYLFALLLFPLSLRFAVPMAAAQSKVNGLGSAALGLAVCMLVLSTMLLLGAVVMRGAAMNGYKPWQFSLKWLLIVMTVFAGVLGFTAYLARLM